MNGATTKVKTFGLEVKRLERLGFSENFRDNLIDLTRKSISIALKYGKPMSTSEGHGFMEKGDNGLASWDSHLGVGVDLIYLGKNEKGKKQYLIDINCSNRHTNFPSHVAAIIISENKIIGIPLLVQGRWMEDLNELFARTQLRKDQHGAQNTAIPKSVYSDMQRCWE